MKDSRIKIIIDTNLWISFLIGQKSASILRDLLLSDKVMVVMTDILQSEIVNVASRTKFARYFSPDAVDHLVAFLQKRCGYFHLNTIPSRCRDPKDDYLLELSLVSEANLLITGDKDLTDMHRFGNCQIMTLTELREFFNY